MSALLVVAFAMVFALPASALLATAGRLMARTPSPAHRHMQLTGLLLLGALMPVLIVVATAVANHLGVTAESGMGFGLVRLMPGGAPSQHWILIAAASLVALLTGGAVPGVVTWFTGLARIRALSKTLGPQLTVPGAPNVVITPLVSSPALVGFTRPLIVLPATVHDFATGRVIDLVCAHERAHARRNDNWRLAVEHLALALLWWCPPLRAIHRALLAAREELCDMEALSNAPAAERIAYGRLLLHVLRTAQRPGLATAGIAGSTMFVHRRMEAILLVESEAHAVSHSRSFAAVAVLATALLAVPVSVTLQAGAEILAGMHGTVLHFERTATPGLNQPGIFNVKSIGGRARAPSTPQRVSFRRRPSGGWAISINSLRPASN